MAEDRLEIVWLGLGQMGKAIVERLLTVPSGPLPYVLHVWNRSHATTLAYREQHAERLAGQPVHFYEQLEQALAATTTTRTGGLRLICSMLPDYDSTERLLFDQAGVAAGGGRTVLLCMSSGSPDGARSFARKLGERWPDVLYVDGCFVGSPHAVRQGLGTLLYSTPQPLADVSPALPAALDVISGGGSHCVCSGSGYGSAKALDYALVDAYFLNFVALAHATGLADAEGIDHALLLQCLTNHAATFPVAWRRIAAQMHSPAPYENQSASLHVWRDFFAHRADYIAARSLSSVVPQLACSTIDAAVASSPNASLSDDLLRLQDIFRPPS